MTDLERMLIERACERLVTQYCHYVDHGQAAKIADQFSDDGVWTSPENTMTGKAALTKGFTARQGRTGLMSRHVCANTLIEVVDADHATGVCYLVLFRQEGEAGRTRSPAQAPSMVGEYRDEFVRTPDGWRFSRREIVVDFVGR